MNGKKILNFLILLSGIILLASCAKDKGNYDYKTLNPVTIDIENVAISYGLERFDILEISPKVMYKGEKVDPVKSQFSELKFSWEMYPAAGVQGITERYILSDSIALKAEMSQRELSWEVLFTVTNTTTGIKAFSKFDVKITPSLAEGWMVLYERDGKTDVGLIANNEISKAQLKKEKLFLDIYSASNGTPLPGTPGSLIFSSANLSAKRLYVQSSQEIAMVVSGTFQKVFDYNQSLFWSKPASTAPILIKATEGRKEFLINNNKVHMIDYTALVQGERAFGDALGGTYGTLAPWMSTSTLGAPFDAIFYDQTNKKFMKLITRGSEIVPISTTQAVTAPFDVNNVGMELLMGDMGWNNLEYLVMKDNANKHWLLTANFRGGEIPNIGKAKYDMSICPEVANINSVTAGYLGEIFYYSANNHLYQFKYLQNTVGQLWTAPAGETITNIALQKYYYTNHAPGIPFDPKNPCKVLYIATYNESKKVGTVYQVEVNQTEGSLVPGTQKEYTGFGKIKAMAWKPLI
ncbi:PKD-like family lipoprotein [Pedobacter hiemivivus]|uniref:PKD-like family protein n=1 Tax=Pedobacter hiemivivus TaxID=2530454 RepID=A0A4R0NA56_9SPHI|nr:PKD-like family lipoprotein [Pedobacter hiemivivus]TCC97080.1 hypothetical protein EZ444_09490 [Pedobacter hiemivivus]